MAAHQSYITLDSVINYYIDESSQSIHAYSRLFNLAFRGMEQLGLDFFYEIRTKKLPVSANKTVELPADYLSYTKIGVLNSIGEIISMKQNSDLALYADKVSDRLSLVKDNTLAASFDNNNAPIFFNYWNNGSYSNMYGLPSGGVNIGNFRIDNDNQVIVLSTGFTYDYLILEYIASPVEGEEYFLPSAFREALISWLVQALYHSNEFWIHLQKPL